ncbi:LD-carboxypeptidase [Actinacidiphila glaucinigra]|uniref:LD-carboxypeptidase n=1 Tax=Actinacidiphila glaucinigra TaxID=235986 RepID=UPI0036EEED4B
MSATGAVRPGHAALRPPPRLSPGATIGIVSTSAWAAERFPERTRRALVALEHALGGPARLLPAEPIDGGVAGPPQVRAGQFLDLLRDPQVGAVLTTIGGNNSNDLLDHLDEAAGLPPKPVVGYSDNTALLLGYQARTGAIVFYGPALLPQFGEWPSPFAETVTSLRHAVVDGGGGELPLPGWWAEPGGDWSRRDEYRRARHQGGPLVLRPGRADGVLFGGNVPTLGCLAGTRWWSPPPGPTVLCVEATAIASEIPRFRHSLVHLRHTGLLDRVTALLVGRAPGMPREGEWRDGFHRTLLECAPADVPIIIDLPFGHTDPLTTLPLGAAVELDAGEHGVALRVLGPTVG